MYDRKKSQDKRISSATGLAHGGFAKGENGYWQGALVLVYLT
jgi:hypothetical protein